MMSVVATRFSADASASTIAVLPYNWGRDPATHAYGHCIDGAPAATCVEQFDAAAPGAVVPLPAVANISEPLVPTLTTIVRVCPSGATLLGDVRKYVPLSTARFASVRCTAASVAFTLRGAAGELVPVTALAPRAGSGGSSENGGAATHVVRVLNVMVPPSGIIDVVVL